MIERLLKVTDAQEESVFLFGARQTGKTTLLLHLFPDNRFYHLLETDTYDRLRRNPSLLRQELADLKRKVVVSVLVNGDKDGQIRAKLCELLRKYGITVCGEDKASAANSNYTLSAQVLWNDKKHNTVYSSTPQIDFTIKGSGNTGTVYSYSGSCEKVATYNAQTTEQMAISRLEELLDQLQLWR